MAPAISASAQPQVEQQVVVRGRGEELHPRAELVEPQAQRLECADGERREAQTADHGCSPPRAATALICQLSVGSQRSMAPATSSG
jgi:hypothetical protein